MPTFYLKTFGCQMNEEESLRIKDYLASKRYRETDDYTKASLVIINTCSIRQTAEDRLLGLLDGVRTKGLPTVKIAVTGCIAGLATDAYSRYKLSTKLRRRLKDVDLFFTAESLSTLGTLLGDTFDEDTYYDFKATHTPYSAYLPIMKGCDNYCSFCIVPYAKGPERSFATKDILEEVRKLQDQGIKEVLLLGQKINSYGLEGSLRATFFAKRSKDSSLPHPFAQLLSEIHEKTSIPHIYFMTSYPTDFTDDLIDTIASLPRVGQYIHIPVQSGSTKVLKAMERRYSREVYDDLLDKMVARLPDMHLSTDFIVGFPGETDADFVESVELMHKYPFTMAYIAPYSPRPGTKAFELGDPIPREVKKERFTVLTKALEESALAEHQNYLNKQYPLLVTKKSGDFLSGRIPNYKEVLIPDTSCMIGEVASITITQADAWRLIGKVITT